MTCLSRRDLAFDAQRSWVVGRFMTGSKLPRADVEAWIERWVEQADCVGVRRDSPAYWGAGRRWIAGQRELASATGKSSDTTTGR